jgi:MinD-like ATPase involved in chromosome partitioning or flagellar assembly
MTAVVPVLVAAAGAPWEATVLQTLDAGAGVVLQKRCVDLADLLATARTGLAGAAVVADTLPGLDADSVVALGQSGTGLVVVLDAGQPADTERLRRLGIRHLLTTDELDRVVAAIIATRASPDGLPIAAPNRPSGPGVGRLTAVWGPAGAPGRTTVAAGLAAELAGRGRATLLVDADPYGGAVGQHLGVLDDVSGLLAAARLANGGRLDAERLGSLSRQVAHQLRLLTGLPRPDRWQEVRPAAFDDVLQTATGLTEHVVVDVGFSLEHDPADPFAAPGPQRNGMTIAALTRADEVLVVGAADPVGLSRLARGLVEIHDLLPHGRPRVVVNRMRPSLGWGEREIRGMVEGFLTPVDVHFLPDDRIAADRALMAGRSLTECGDSTLGRALAGLAAAVAGDGPPPAGRRRVRRRRAGRDR